MTVGASDAIGIAGLGRMGHAMAMRLLDCGFRLNVWNRSTSATDAMGAAGAIIADSPKELVEQSSIVITMLRDESAVAEVYRGKDGLLGPYAHGRLFIEMSTIRPQTVKELHQGARKCGAVMLDAPVSGTVPPARNGKLLAMVGGETDSLQRATPVLKALCRRIVHAGSAGSGAMLKLVVNLPLAVYWHSLAEALDIGERGGLDRSLMLDTIEDSSAALAVLGLKKPDLLGQKQAVAFDLASMHKDLLMIIQTATALGANISASAAALGAYTAAINEGLGAEDAVAVARPRNRSTKESK